MPKAQGGHDQTELITLAIAGIDAQIRQLQDKRGQLSELLSGAPSAPASASAPAGKAAAAAPGKKRVFSAATRKKLQIAAKRRWERVRAEKKAAARAAKS